ncbi:MAG: hypothetical protein E6G39_07660 [Actinobacteria bacterium]|nr:MAG: hypothetical protein E6G39_07660 [Actinomycetota bacterium]
MAMLDLEPAATELTGLLGAVTDDQLGSPTPCENTSVGALLDHLMSLSQAGGATMPAEQIAVVAVDELVLHGWDLARATGQRFKADPASTAAVLAFTTEMAKPEHAPHRKGLFGPVVETPKDASDLDRALGLAGRDVGWKS